MATRTISNAGGNWNATAAWVEGAVPVAGDDVVATGTSGNLVVNVASANLKSFNLTGYVGTMSGSSAIIVAPVTGSGTVVCLLAGTITWTGSLALEPAGTSILNFTSGGKTVNNTSAQLGSGTGTVSQQDNLTVTAIWNVYNGTWNTNGFTVSCANYTQNGGAGALLNCTNSTINASNGFSVTQGTVTATGSTINHSGANTFVGKGQTYNIVNFSGNGTIISGNNTFATLNVNTAGLTTGLKVTINSIQTVTNFTTNGSVGNLAKILSTSAGSHFHLTTGSAQISVDYMSITDSTVDQANTWYAGANSTDVSGNSGWVFTAPPPPPIYIPRITMVH